MLQAEQRLPHATEKEKRSFPMERGSLSEAPPRVESAVHAEVAETPLPYSKPKVMPRSSLGDFGEARWLLSHRWTETSPILPDIAHDSRNQRRVVSLSALSLLSACVRLLQLREVHRNLQQALNPYPLTDGRRAHYTGGSLAYLRCYACASCSRYPLNPP